MVECQASSVDVGIDDVLEDRVASFKFKIPGIGASG
jgi:hypothetical protein